MARFLEWQKSASGALTAADSWRLREAVNQALEIYNYWRPELRYKVVEITEPQFNVVKQCGDVAQRESAQILGGVTCRSFVVRGRRRRSHGRAAKRSPSNLPKNWQGSRPKVDRSSSRSPLTARPYRRSRGVGGMETVQLDRPEQCHSRGLPRLGGPDRPGAGRDIPGGDRVNRFCPTPSCR